MTAFFVSRIKVKDAEKLQAYAAAAGPTIVAHGGSLVVLGKAEKTLVGADAEPHMTSVAQFPDMKALNDWFGSAEYQQHAELRDEAGDVQLIAYEVPAA